MTSKERQKGSIVNSFLNSVEKIGNKLPDPSVLFFLMYPLSIQVHIKLSMLKIF